MIRCLWLSFLILFTSIQAKAIDAVVSHTIFYLPDDAKLSNSTPYAEVYWQINQHSLHYIRNADSSLVAKVITDITFRNDTGVIRHEHFLQQSKGANVAVILSHGFIDIGRYAVTNGNIKMTITFADLTDSNNKFKFTDSFIVAPPVNTAFFSGIELLDTAYTSTANSVFLKGGKIQIPLCANFIDDNRSILHYYTELYGADLVSKDDYPLIQKIFITKNENEAPYLRFYKIDTIKSVQEINSTGEINIKALTSGNYYINAILENSSKRVIASNDLFFQRLNLHPPAADTTTKNDTALESVAVVDLNKTFIGKYNLTEIRKILRMLLPLSDPSEAQTINGFLKKPDELYMRYFIYNHFVAIDRLDPGKAWKEFSNKIIQVNKLFSEGGHTGYETERGYVYLRYGQPTDIITVENEAGSLPYEIWQYNNLVQLNGKYATDAVFLFYRQNEMLSGYRLLHSNVIGEIQNKSWRSYLYTTNSGSAGSTNSRAEQYIGNK